MADLEIISQPPELPPEILFFHILPRLPAKSVFRFHCVAKQWQSFLKTPTFSDLQWRHQSRHKILFMSAEPPYTFRTIDCEAPEGGLSATRPLPFEAQPEDIEILASFNGLLCVGINFDINQYSNFIIWNPSTGEYKQLSRTGSAKYCYEYSSRLAFELYYNCYEDEYKLLCVNHGCNVHVYPLKSDSWRKVDDHNIQIYDPYVFSERWGPSVVLNEKFYFLKQVMGRLDTSRPSYSIITFDMKTEKFSEIATPSSDFQRTLWLNIMVVRECIHLCNTYKTINEDRVIDMWRMDGEGDWKKVKTYFEKPSFPWLPWFPSVRVPLHVMNNGNWLMYSRQKKKGYVYKLNLETYTKEDLLSFIDMLIPPFAVRYVETFVPVSLC